MDQRWPLALEDLRAREQHPMVACSSRSSRDLGKNLLDPNEVPDFAFGTEHGCGRRSLGGRRITQWAGVLWRILAHRKQEASDAFEAFLTRL
jgi:hypothetical protein